MTKSPATPLPPPKERRRLREAASLTQAQVAARLGVARETVRGWEAGRTSPRGRKGEAYAKLLTTLAGPDHRKPPEPNRKPDVAGHQPENSALAEEPGAVATAVAENPVPAVQPAEPVEPAGSVEPAPVVVRAVRAPETVAGPEPEPVTSPADLTPAQAFDALYAFCAPALVRQTYLLTGRRELARESVERSFQLAWQRWPEVAVDRDPAGWVRAAAYEYALSPWHRFRPRHRQPEPPPVDASDRALLDVLLHLPPPYRRALLLYDGVGLGLPETAAETEASTPATANRLLHARAAVATHLPELADPAALHRRLTGLASAGRLRAAKPPAVRYGGERRARFWTRAAIAFTIALIGTTALTVRTAPTHYEPPVAPGAEVHGVPPHVAPGPLSEAELELRSKLREETVRGPERLVPRPG
ncbi:sigma factor-like helix-turn-helix DNA-binding protein [Streptomyces sp. NPDC087903]|uniref:sigma factor-like helix-turn-helix DNA-binding protein n=1 Tax=Streptomyces sp. NPDC087903 TaxID=3365819 RepID=UPI00380451E5